MKRHVLCRRQIRGGNFGPRRCKNESDLYTLTDIVDMPVEDIYKDSTGYCYDRASLIKDINNQVRSGRQPIYPHNRQPVSRSVLGELGIQAWEPVFNFHYPYESQQQTLDREEMRAEEARIQMLNALEEANRNRPTAESLQNVPLRRSVRETDRDWET